MDFIVAIGNTAANGVRILKFVGTEDELKVWLANAVKEDKEKAPDEYCQGTETPESILYDCSTATFEAYGIYDEYRIDYTAQLEALIQVEGSQDSSKNDSTPVTNHPKGYGQWVTTDEQDKTAAHYCSNCHDFYTRDWHNMNFCPACGAVMCDEVEIDNPCYHCYNGATGQCSMTTCKHKLKDWSEDIGAETIIIPISAAVELIRAGYTVYNTFTN